MSVVCTLIWTNILTLGHSEQLEMVEVTKSLNQGENCEKMLVMFSRVPSKQTREQEDKLRDSGGMVFPHKEGSEDGGARMTLNTSQE